MQMKVGQLQSIKKEQSIIRNKRGFSLIEALFGVSIFGLLITGFIGAFIYGQESNVLAGNRSRAIFLAEEGLEVTSNMVDSNFGLLQEGQHGLDTQASQWVLAGTEDVTGLFTRQLDISIVDNLTRQVVATVNWQQNRQRSGLVTLVRTFTNWLIKTLSETTQADFASGNINGVEVVNDSGGEVQNLSAGEWIAVESNDSYNLDGNGNANDVDIHFASQRMATVADGTSGNEFNLFDISDMSNTGLSYIGGLDFGFDLLDVSIYDGYAYVATEDNASELVVIRLSDMTQVNYYDLPSNSNAEAIKAVSGVVYIATVDSGSEEFYALDISDPEGAITELGAVEIGDDVFAIDISGSYAYLATAVNSNELTVLRLTDYANINSYSTGGNDMYDVVVSNNKAYIAGNQSGSPEVYVVDISSPEGTLTTLGTAHTSDDVNGIATDDTGKIFVATSDNSKELTVIDDDYTELSSYDIGGNDNYLGITMAAGYVYLVGGSNTAELTVLQSSMGWQYRKKHTINGSSAGAQSNYPIQIFVYYGSGTDSGDTVYCNSNCQDDFGDIRFTNSSGDSLDYFMDEVYTSSYARFWVEIDSLPASPDSTDIYMLYSNEYVDTTSSGENTFEAFVDYTIDGTESYGGQDYDPTQYDIQTPNPPNNEDSQIRLWGNNWKYSLNAITVNGNGSQYLEWWYNSTGQEGEAQGVGFDYDNSLTSSNVYRAYGTQTNLGITADVEYNDGVGGWQLITNVLNDYSGTFDRITTINDADGGEATDSLFRNVRVRARVSPEPTHGAWGAQESGSFGASGESLFSYKKIHAINGTSAGAQNDYPIQLFVYYGSGTDSGDTVYCDSKCQSDFGDIRFTNSGGTDLDYFIDEAVDSDFARIWVEVDTIPASPGSVDIHMLYGNSTVDSTSSGEDTFEVFVDYVGDGTVSYGGQDANSTQYEIQTPNPPNNENSQIHLWGNNWKYSLNNVTLNGNGSQYLEWWFNSTGAEGEIHGVGVDNNDSISNTYMYQTYGTQSWGRVADTQYDDSVGGWQLIRHSLDEFSGTFDRVTTLNDADAGQATDNLTRNIRIRTRVVPEPTHGSWSAEESLGAPKFIGAFTSDFIDSGSANTTWTDVIWQATSTDASHYLRFQLRTAPDNAGSPGTWTEWLGPDGSDSYFSDPTGDGLANQIHRDGTDDQWVQYRAFLYGTTESSPILEQIDLRYNN